MGLLGTYVTVDNLLLGTNHGKPFSIFYARTLIMGSRLCAMLFRSEMKMS